MNDLQRRIAETRQICADQMHAPPLAQIGEKLSRSVAELGSPESIVRSLIRARDRRADLARVAAQIGAPDEIAGAAPQRALLLAAALVSLNRLEGLPVESSVKRLICDEFQFFAKPAPREIALFAPESASFLSLCKLSLLERFPAGQFHWEISGFPRSWLLRVPPSALPRLIYFLAAELRGFSPCIVPHMATRRKNPLMLIEKESDRSWFRMACSAQIWPGIRGLVASSWLHSPETYRVSPHLAFINKP